MWHQNGLLQGGDVLRRRRRRAATNHPVTFSDQAVGYSQCLAGEFECCLAHGLRLGALLRGRIPEGTLLLPPKRLPLPRKGGERVRYFASPITVTTA